MHALSALWTLATAVTFANAQYPSTPSGLTTVQSRIQPGARISFKETKICETTPGVKSYSGYVHLPASVLGDVPANYNISTFFWFFEARNNAKTAPLVIYLAGGPGEGSSYPAVSSESGPCYVNRDGNSTTLNPWSFNNHVNMLYIDQPVQSGLSYDSLVKGTYDLISNQITPLSQYQTVPKTNNTFYLGTFASQNPLGTTNNTVQSARAVWHFAQTWLAEFPNYKSQNKKVSVWGHSYGGYWAPAVAAYLDKQLKAQPKSSCLRDYSVDTLGIANGCSDIAVQGLSYMDYSQNNTYGLKYFPEAYAQDSVNNFTKPGGCLDLVKQCRAAGDQLDPNWTGANPDVNAACEGALLYCVAYAAGYFTAGDRTPFDIAVKQINGADPCPFYLPVFKYLNQPWVQQAMGVPVNWTVSSNVVLGNFGLDFVNTPGQGTGDPARKDSSDIQYILQNNKKVTLVYGDRDTRCNWFGGESTALSMQYSGRQSFANAGYENIVSNSTYIGGLVRQYDKLSFSRVFQAGHLVNAYQPETVYQIFQRAIFDRDVATGKASSAGYSSKGPKSARGVKQALPNAPQTCIVQGAFEPDNVWAGIIS